MINIPINAFPKILKKITLLLAQKAKDLSFDCICGVPYAALAISSTLAYELERPLIMRRSSTKKYGTGKKIEGVFKENDRCLVIEDVVTTATGIKETIDDLEEHILKVSDAIILFDREQGGIQWMENKGYKLHVLFTISDFMHVLVQEGKISDEYADSILSWTKEHQVPGVNWRTE